MPDHEIRTRTLSVGGRTRNYLLYVPPGLAEDVAPPVVLAFHGAGTNAWAMRAFCGLDDKAALASFVLVYPSGTGRRNDLLTWNAGNCCGYAHHYHVNDVQYVAALLDDLRTVVPFD